MGPLAFILVGRCIMGQFGNDLMLNPVLGRQRVAAFVSSHST
jgi:hypothetical protein